MAELRRIRLRAVHEGWEARLDFKSLVDDPKAWDPEPRYNAITRAREQWMVLGHHDLADDPEAIVRAVWELFLEDTQMRHHVLHTHDQDITKDDDWRAIAQTYAYVVLQKYNREVVQT